MNLFDYAQAYRESLSVYEALRRLGFESDDIYFMIAGAAHPGPKQTVIILRTQGKEYVCVTGELEGSAEEIHTNWMEMASALVRHEISEEDLDKSWQESLVMRYKSEFVASIMAAGIKPPSIVKRLREKLN